MFNVLFVFFGMAINIALVVHDKINLQNSVDLAAYYAAMKQSELLNVIAHENYQIRQSFKLLSWRYRVIGTLGLVNPEENKHPVTSGQYTDVPWGPAKIPKVCIVYKPQWKETPEGENLCNTESLKIPKLPKVEVIAGFLPVNVGIAALSSKLIGQFNVQCQNKAAVDWYFAMSILHAFRLDQRNRMQVITGVANGMSKESKNGDFVDLDGNSVMEGARRTFMKNLTYANRQSFESAGSFEIMNSLQGIDPKRWLPPVSILPTLIYIDTTDPTSASGCEDIPTNVFVPPQQPKSIEMLKAEASAGGYQAADLLKWAKDSFLEDSDYQFTMGVEKNPWYMAYMGIKATTTPRPIFFPMGPGVQMVARTFAKPFGGRIGPWYKSGWSKGAENSSGDLVDPWIPPRREAGGVMNSPDDPRRFPNYSRYPGDPYGMTTKLALNSVVGMKTVMLSLGFYQNIKADMDMASNNDILAWDYETNKSPQIRDIEIAAITPDLFDITYYSIEPNFAKNYYPRLKANKTKLGIDPAVPIRTDIGMRPPNDMTIQDQMKMTKEKAIQRDSAFYFVEQKAHLLTSWLPGKGGFVYGVGESMENFGKCSVPDDGMKITNPGSCVAGGGRTGYSVKLINRDALNSSEHAIGGSVSAKGGIENPPKDGW